MSAPSRGRGAAAKPNLSPAPRGRGTSRANSSNPVRGRGRGRGGHTGSSSTANTQGAGLLQQLRSGTAQRSLENGPTSTTTTTGRGKTVRGRASAVRSRGSHPKSVNASAQPHAARSSSPAPATTNYRDFMSQMTDKFTTLKSKRETERKRAIQDGFLADPEKKTNLANAITPVGTCTDMCPEFERVERIVQNMVDKAEKVPNEATGRDLPSEERMIKRFRRSAAGYDEQLPSDIRTPNTLKRTLDYLLDRVIGGGERLATIHKFVWDRTRGIRNDFSIQQVTKPEDVSIAVDCYERIARFHILSLHQLSNPDNLLEGEHFDAHQEREQLNNTLISLMFYYEDHRDRIPLPNEPEFRSYLVLFELQALTPDLEERMQSWPRDLLYHPKVQAAFKLYTATSNTVFEQGPLRPLTPFTLAQANPGKFWKIMASQEISYMMACVAEMNFAVVRFTALDALWRSGKSAPQGQQAKNYDWTVTELMNQLGFDDEDQTIEFVQEFELALANAPNGELYLDFTASAASALEKTALSSKQIFSYEIVEAKRHRRTLVAVINNINVATAIRKGLVVEASTDDAAEEDEDKQSLFIPESTLSQPAPPASAFGSALNPSASTFHFSGLTNLANTPSTQQPAISTKFGENFSSPAQTFGSGSPTSTSSFNTNYPTTERPAAAAPAIFGFNTGSFGATAKPTSSSPFSNAFGTFNAPQSDISGPSQDPTPIDKAGFSFGKPSMLFTPQSQTEPEVKKSMPVQVGYVFGKPVQLSQPSTDTSVIGGLPTTAQNADTGKSQNALFAPAAAETSPNLTAKTQSPSTDKPQPHVFAFPSPIEPIPKPTPVGPLLPTSQQTGPEQSPSVFSFPASHPAQPSLDDQNKSPTFFSFSPQSAAQIDQAEPTSTTQALFSAPQSVSSLSTKAPIFDSPHFSIPSQTALFPLQRIDHPTHVEHKTITTTPAASPKGPSFGDFKFPSVTEAKPTAASGKLSSFAASTTSPSLAPYISTNDFVSSKIESPSEILPAEPVFTEGDRVKLVENASHVALVQDQGILEYLIGNHISNILQKVVADYRRDLTGKILTYIKTQHLSRKFFAAWKSKVQRASLKRQAQNRRQMLAAMMRAEAQKKKRSETELEEILAATQETKRIQEQQRRMKQDAQDAKQNRESTGTALYDVTKSEAGRLAGTKRKVVSANDYAMTFRGAAPSDQQSSLHKRSKTLDTDNSFTASIGATSVRSSVTDQGRTAASRFSQPFFSKSSGLMDARRAMSSQKVDATKTDYFKLKAMGIDPEAPLVPDTAASLEAKRKRREEERQLRMSRVRSRRGSSTNSLPLLKATPQVSPRLAMSTTTTREPTGQGEVIRGQATSQTGEDEFLRQLREAREAMAEDAKWFKTQSAELEEEILQREELNRRQQSLSSHDESVQLSPSGLTMSNGFEYRPLGTLSGASLSRTERRIRATGAHGLATKPVRPYTAGYTPVAMSRTSALRYHSSGAETSASSLSTGSKKRPRQEQGLLDEDEAVNPGLNLTDQQATDAKLTQRSKRLRGGHVERSIRGRPRDTRTQPTGNMFASLKDMGTTDSDEVDEDEEDRETNTSAHPCINGDGDNSEDGIDREGSREREIVDDQESHTDRRNANSSYTPNFAESIGDGHYAEDEYDSDREEEEDDDEDEDLDEEEEEGGDEDQDNHLQTYRGPQPSSGYSAIADESQIGPGASAEDAFVLSD